MEEKTEKIRVYGIVQGVGFRPAAARYAAECAVTGYVCNRGSFVEIVAQGRAGDVDDFIRRILETPPKRAQILKWDKEEDTDGTPAQRYTAFEIRESSHEGSEIFVSPDIGICPDCRRELFDVKNRRYHHPFINCTQCGPRLTILDSVPYDRQRTSMKNFPMCPRCRNEYEDPASRRYDAQPVCCNDCGPEVYVVGSSIRRDAAIKKTRQVIAEGGIAAVKGIGGFHLCCNAQSFEAVQRLRRLKARPAKPFAVMMRDISVVKRECVADEAAKKILTSWQKPIVLLPKKEGGSVAENTAPDNKKLGVFLPYAPIQCLLFDEHYGDGLKMPDALVMTSGNTGGAPICRSDEEVEEELGTVVDIILSGTRPILTRCDDSVMELYRGSPYMIRRSRGYAPLPFFIERAIGNEGIKPSGESSGKNDHCVLAIGGELKNTFCIGKGRLMYPSSYIGDLEDERSGLVLKETVTRYLRLFEAEPECIVCDLHPGYRSTKLAEELSLKAGIPLVRVQHHYAHILSLMAEKDVEGKVIGVCFDGTGYGMDGNIWGGEILVCDPDGFVRAGSIMPFVHAGGDSASKEGWRIAASMLDDLFKEKAGGILEELGVCKRSDAAIICAMKKASVNCITSTSCGRLFDAVSAILGIRRVSTFEGEASTALMYRAMSCSPHKGRVWDEESFTVMEEKASEKETEEVTDEDKGMSRTSGASSKKGRGRYLLRTDLLVKKIAEIAAEYRRGQTKDTAPDTKSAVKNTSLEGASSAAALKKEEKKEERKEENKEGETKRSVPFRDIPKKDSTREDSVKKSLMKECTSADDSAFDAASLLALYFHEALADMMADLVIKEGEDTGIHVAALSGGCFQNLLLTDLVRTRLEKRGFTVLLHSQVPPNDGGIALGQALYGERYLMKRT